MTFSQFHFCIFPKVCPFLFPLIYLFFLNIAPYLQKLIRTLSQFQINYWLHFKHEMKHFQYFPFCLALKRETKIQLLQIENTNILTASRTETTYKKLIFSFFVEFKVKKLNNVFRTLFYSGNFFFHMVKATKTFKFLSFEVLRKCRKKNYERKN